MSIPRVLIVTSCTSKKLFQPENQLKCQDFLDPSLLKTRSKELRQFSCSAKEMYLGTQHLQLMEGIKILRQAFGQNVVDLAIVSAGYGVINENKLIVPYSVTFSTMSNDEIDDWAQFLDIHKNFESLITNYDLIFILLGEHYLRALQLPVKTRASQTLIFLASWGSTHYIQVNSAHTFVLPLSNAEAKTYGYGLVGLKGFLFKQYAQRVVKETELLSITVKSPERFKEVIDARPTQLSLPFLKTNSQENKRSEISELIPLPLIPPAANYDNGMQYFIPEWDDYVDPHFDFLQDSLSPRRVPHKDDVYAHQIFDSPNYDGILVSKVVFDKSKKKQKEILESGIHHYIRFQGEIMGDCGAFGYIQEDNPPYSTEEILDYYQSCGFNYGVSVDHLVVGKFAQPGIREKRYNLTIKNAEDFLKKHAQYNYQFTPIGAVQGWSPETYAEAVKYYIQMGYTYLGLGGLAREKTEIIIKILLEIRPHLKPDTKVHLFGVARLNAIPIFRHLGVTSFDSASPLRKAWLDPAANYHGVNQKIYPAIRIPQAIHKNSKIKKLMKLDFKYFSSMDLLKISLKISLLKWELIQSLEKELFSALRAFEQDQNYLDTVLEAILAYSKPFLTEKLLAKYTPIYKSLLLDKPWKDCDCVICQRLGIDVVIFRGNDRNRRRGFHNTYVFYKRFKSLLEDMDKPKEVESLNSTQQIAYTRKHST